MDSSNTPKGSRYARSHRAAAVQAAINDHSLERFLTRAERGTDPDAQFYSRLLQARASVGYRFGNGTAATLRDELRLPEPEALALGVALDATYAYLAGHMPFDRWERLLNLIAQAGLPTFHRRLEVAEAGSIMGDTDPQTGERLMRLPTDCQLDTERCDQALASHALLLLRAWNQRERARYRLPASSHTTRRD